MTIQEKAQNIIKNLQAFMQTAGRHKAVVGLSGGVDSALTAKLGVEALKKENVYALIMPHEGVTDPKNTQDAEDWAKELGMDYKIIPINEYEKPFESLHWGHSGLAEMNIKARIRANLLYHYANTHNAVVLGTGNKTEEKLGYFTKYGDGAVDVLPIGDLYKNEVWEMSKILGLPEAIISKKPTAELRSAQTDEEEIGLSYAEIDRILQKFEAGGRTETEAEKHLQKRIEDNAHKSKMPPVIPSAN